MAEDFSNSGGRVRLRASATYSTPPGRKHGLGIRWVLALVILGIFAWASRGQIGNLFFARGGSSNRPTGEWVGQMEITGEYDPIAHTMKAYEKEHARALVYMKLEGTDSFMNEYGGSGELILAGDPTPHPLHVGAMGLEDSGRISGAFIVPHLTFTAEGTYTPGNFHLGNDGPGGIKFAVDFRRGRYSDFQSQSAHFQ